MTPFLFFHHVCCCVVCQVSLVYAQRNSKMILLDRDSAALEAAKLKCEEAGSSDVLCLTVDVTDFKAVAASFSSALERFKVLDVLVLCAGLGAHHLFDATPDLGIFRKLMEVNFYGYLHCVKAAYKPLCESNGTLIAVTSFSGEVGLPYRTAYCASKFAVVRKKMRKRETRITSHRARRVCMVWGVFMNVRVCV